MPVGQDDNRDFAAPGTEAIQRLETLLSYRGRDRGREILGVDDATLDGLLAGAVDWPQGVQEKVQQGLEMFRALGYTVETPEEAEAGDAGEPEAGDDPSSAGEPDADGLDRKDGDRNYGPEAGRGAEEGEAGDGRDQGSGSWQLWKARDLAITRFFRSGVPEHRQLAALAVVVRLEGALMNCFNEAPTEPGARWDGYRRQRETGRRLALHRQIDLALNAMHSGPRGLGNWLLGRDRVDARKLRRDLLAEAAAAGPGYQPMVVDPLMVFAQDLHPLFMRYIEWHYPQTERRGRR